MTLSVIFSDLTKLLQSPNYRTIFTGCIILPMTSIYSITILMFNSFDSKDAIVSASSGFKTHNQIGNWVIIFVISIPQ